MNNKLEYLLADEQNHLTELQFARKLLHKDEVLYENNNMMQSFRQLQLQTLQSQTHVMFSMCKSRCSRKIMR